MEPTTILDYYFDDPGEINLHGPLVIPPFPKNTPDFTVVGWTNVPNVEPGTFAYQAAQVWGTMASTLAYIMNLKNDPPYIKTWATIFNLVAIPRAGNQLNAYYDRSSLRFFWGKDPKTNVTIYTCDAVGIVAHELGHAILDAIRPDLWNTAVLEFFAFHEAFGDILAISSVLQHDEVIKQMILETSKLSNIPDLWQTNVASKLARQLGHAIYFTSHQVIGAERYLRNSFNDFKYVDPLTLKLGTSDKELTQEPHNFGRIFSGAWYECFCELFKADYTIHKPKEVVDAVKNARDTMVRCLLDAVMIAPSQLQFLQSISMTMVDVLNKQNKHEEAEIVKKVFLRRNLWIDKSHQVNSPKIINTTDVDSTSKNNHMKINIGATVVTASKIIEVELPKVVSVKHGEDVKSLLGLSVSNFLDYISIQELLGNTDENNMFTISEDDKLIRNYICSSFRSLPQLSQKVPGIAS